MYEFKNYVFYTCILYFKIHVSTKLCKIIYLQQILLH